jgi:hypothetical protein
MKTEMITEINNMIMDALDAVNTHDEDFYIEFDRVLNKHLNIYNVNSLDELSSVQLKWFRQRLIVVPFVQIVA